METLRKHLPVLVLDGLSDLQKIAVRYEERIYTAAIDQSDYLRKVSLTMRYMESQRNTQRYPGSTQLIPNQSPPSPAPGLPPQDTNPAQSSASLRTSLPNLGQSLPGVNQTSTLQNMSGMPQTARNNGLAQGNRQDSYDAPRQLAKRQQEQQEMISQLICHQQKMLMNQKLQQNSVMHQHASQGSQQHDCHTSQMRQASLPSMNTGVQSSSAAGSQHVPEPQATTFSVPITQQNSAYALQAGLNMETAQGNNFSSLQQGLMSGALHQGSTGPMQGAMNPQQQSCGNILPHNSMSTMHPNTNSMQANAIQQLNLPQKEPHMISQLVKRQMQRQMLQQQFALQQKLQRQQQAHLLRQQQAHVLAAQRHSTHDVDELKVGQVAAMEYGIYQQPVQCSSYYRQLKQGVAFPISPPENLQASSPQIFHHSSQVAQQYLLPCPLNTRNPLHSDDSPVVPSPSPLVAPSPISVHSVKALSKLSSLTDTGKAGPQQTLLAPQALSVVANTPSTSALPLLAEFTTADGNQANVQTRVPTKSSAAGRPLDRMLKTYIHFVKLLVVSVIVVVLFIIAYNEGRHWCRM